MRQELEAAGCEVWNMRKLFETVRYAIHHNEVYASAVLY